MKSCQNCIHADVCKMWWSDAEDRCPHHKSESDALHILRLIYADLTARANLLRKKSDEHFLVGQPGNAVRLRNEAEAHASDAARVKKYCRIINFDPSVGKEADK